MSYDDTRDVYYPDPPPRRMSPTDPQPQRCSVCHMVSLEVYECGNMACTDLLCAECDATFCERCQSPYCHVHRHDVDECGVCWRLDHAEQAEARWVEHPREAA